MLLSEVGGSNFSIDPYLEHKGVGPPLAVVRTLRQVKLAVLANPLHDDRSSDDRTDGRSHDYVHKGKTIVIRDRPWTARAYC